MSKNSPSSKQRRLEWLKRINSPEYQAEHCRRVQCVNADCQRWWWLSIKTIISALKTDRGLVCKFCGSKLKPIESNDTPPLPPKVSFKGTPIRQQEPAAAEVS